MDLLQCSAHCFAAVYTESTFQRSGSDFKALPACPSNQACFDEGVGTTQAQAADRVAPFADSGATAPPPLAQGSCSTHDESPLQRRPLYSSGGLVHRVIPGTTEAQQATPLVWNPTFLRLPNVLLSSFHHSRAFQVDTFVSVWPTVCLTAGTLSQRLMMVAACISSSDSTLRSAPPSCSHT